MAHLEDKSQWAEPLHRTPRRTGNNHSRRFFGLCSTIRSCLEAHQQLVLPDGLDRASLEFSTDLASDLMVLHVVRLIDGRNVAKEYFFVGSDRLRFVRMENDEGEAVQNEYVFPNYETGIVPAGDTEEEWASVLDSADKADVLSALVFLGGRHITEPQRLSRPSQRRASMQNCFRNWSAARVSTS